MKNKNPTILRAHMSRLITNAWCHLNGNKETQINEDIDTYKRLEKEMNGIIPNEDIDEYRNQFSNLPWLQCGYQIPQLEEILK